MPAVQFNDLPKKALNSIFKHISQCERQKLRQVCYFWRRLIDEDFPVELVITQDNYQRLFRCPNAVTVEIQSLTTEYTDEVAFGSNVHSIQFSGKVLSSNIFSILRYCSELQVLRFTSLKQVLGIQGTDSVKLPKTTTVEIRVRPDQETFTSDEIIVISVLRQILFGTLNTILITTRNPLDGWDDDDDGDDQSQRFNGFDDGTSPFTMGTVSPMSSARFNPGMSGGVTNYPSFNMSMPLPMPENDDDSTGFSVVEMDPTLDDPEIVGPNPTPIVAEPAEAGTQTTNTNLHVIINRAANFRNTPGNGPASSHASSSASTRRVRYNMSEFEARLFYANLELLVESATDSNVMSILNGYMSQAMDSSSYFEVTGSPAPIVKHTIFFEFLRNNHLTLRNFQVKTRSDFMCFGNLSSFTRDLPKVQLEEMDYSFGRMRVCSEYPLLRAQTKLKRIRLQVLDDMWGHLMTAVEQSQDTLIDLDVKVMSMSEDRADISPISRCQNMKSLKLLHFFEKESLCFLPRSLNKLILNGPVSYKDMDTWTRDLVELVDLTLLLNLRGDKIDLHLFKKFLKMPKMSRLAFIQCPMDLDNIQSYIDTSIKPHSPGAIRFVINGPKEIKELPFIQYVHTFIEPEKFNRDQILIDDRLEINQA